MDMFVDQLAAEAEATTASAAAAFPTLDDFDEGTTGAMERPGKRQSIPGLERTEHPHPTRNIVCSVAPNSTWILLHGEGMQDTNE